MLRSLSRISLVVAVGMTAVAVSAAPASAMASVSVTSNCGYGQWCTGYAQSVPQVGTGSSVQVSCTAVTPYTVQATVVQCYIEGNNGDVHWTDAVLTQGRVSTLTETFDAWSLRSNAYRICTGAGIFNGTYYGPANFVCGAVI